MFTGTVVGSKVISLCPAFFNELSLDEQVSVFIHEGLHAHAQVLDHAYWNGVTWEDLNHNPVEIDSPKLINNAHSYEHFFRCWIKKQRERQRGR